MKPQTDLKLIAALVTVAIVWGTTYLGIRIAVQTIPPWFVAAIRQILATLILLVYLLRTNKLKWIGFTDFKRQFILGNLMFVLANGLTTVAEQILPSGLTSLLAALSPLVIFMGSVLVGIQNPTIKGFAGVVIGFAGVAFIFREGLGDLLDPNYKKGVLILFTAVIGWAIGTIYSKVNAHKSTDLFVDLFYQFGCAAVVQTIFAFVFSKDINPSSWSINSIAAVIYLAIFGSVIAYFAYSYALKKVTATEVSILSYFNTIIALFLGWLILNEPITFDLVIATVLIIIGVFITNYKKKQLLPA